MSSYYSARLDALMLKCDGCGLKVEVCKKRTDRLLIHGYIHENGWMTTKMSGKWLNLCPDCKDAIFKEKRDRFIERTMKGART